MTALAVAASLALTAVAQQTPLRVVQGGDGALYLVQGQSAWTLIPDPIADSEFGALTLSGQISGTLPAQAGPLRVVQVGDGGLFLVQGSNTWALSPAQISDAGLGALDLSGELDGVIPSGLLATPPPQAEPPAPPAAHEPAPAAAPPCAMVHPVATGGTVVTTVITGLPTAPTDFFPTHHACDGVFGIAFDSSNNLYAAIQANGDVFKFGPGSGNAASASATGRALGPTGYDLAFGSNGELYGVRPLTNGDLKAGAVVQIHPQLGTVVRTVAQSLLLPTWMASDPVNGDLYVTNGGTGYLLSPNLWKIHDPSGASGGPTVSIFATDPGGFTQLAFAPNGTLYALARDGRVLTFKGANASSSATGVVFTKVTPNSVGLALGPLGPDGQASSLYFAVPDLISRIDLPSGSVTALVSGGEGAFFDLKVGRDRCLYANAYADILKVTNSLGSCDLTPTTGGG